MMLLAGLFLVLATFGGAFGDAQEARVCKSGNYAKLQGFGQKSPISMCMPCKYLALKKQECGKYRITLTPGNEWVKKEFHLTTVWLSIYSDDANFEIRTSNKIVIKFLDANGKGRSLFQDANSNTQSEDKFYELFEETISTKDGVKWAHLKARNGDFTFSMTPWHPRESSYQEAMFRFECSSEDMLYPFTTQMCGNGSKSHLSDLTTATSGETPFNLPDKFENLVVLYHIFKSHLVQQTNEKCQEAVNIFRDTCDTFDKTLRALKHCHEILTSASHTLCVTRFSCDPMDVFNNCMKWGCMGEGFVANTDAEKEVCFALGEGIDLCPDFVSTSLDVNLTRRLIQSKCYKEYFPYTE